MQYRKISKPDEATLELIKRSGSNDLNVAVAAQYELAKAFAPVLREGVLVGDIVRGIYEARQVTKDFEMPLDLLAPGEEKFHVAYTNPGNGRIPERQVEADYVKIPTYGIASSIDWLLRFARDADYNVVGRAMQVFETGFVWKLNNDGWHTLLGAGVDRNIVVYDADATAGQFTKRLVSLMKVMMKRQAGGNSASLSRGTLTDIFLSPESIENIRNWGLDQVDEITRREIYVSSDSQITRVFGVNLHSIDELGEGQAYQLFYTNNLGGQLNGTDSELIVGLDMSKNDSFIMPIKSEVEIFPDPMLHRQQRMGYYGWGEFGFGVLDGRRVILGSC